MLLCHFAPVTLTRTLMHEFDLDLLKMYWHTKNEVYIQAFKRQIQTQAHGYRDRRDRTHYHVAFARGKMCLSLNLVLVSLFILPGFCWVRSILIRIIVFDEEILITRRRAFSRFVMTRGSIRYDTIRQYLYSAMCKSWRGRNKLLHETETVN